MQYTDFIVCGVLFSSFGFELFCQTLTAWMTRSPDAFMLLWLSLMLDARQRLSVILVIIKFPQITFLSNSG